jgi:hypothetical protein
VQVRLPADGIPAFSRATERFVGVRSPRIWLTLITIGGFTGGGLAIASAKETGWLTHLSLSSLGVDSGASVILNSTLVAIGTMFAALGLSLDSAFASLRSAGRLSSRASQMLRVGFIFAGAAIALAGVFHNDGQLPYLIHHLAAFTTPIALIASILGGRLALGDLGRRFDWASIAIPVTCICLFVAAYIGHLLPYAVMEIICFGLIGVWLWAFEARLQAVSVTLRRIPSR